MYLEVQRHGIDFTGWSALGRYLRLRGGLHAEIIGSCGIKIRLDDGVEGK